MFILDLVSCGGADGLHDIDAMIPAFTTMLVNAIKIFIPILLIFFGMLDLGKAVMSNDEKEMKGAQGKFIKRCVYAVIVFFIVAVVQLLFGVLDKSSDQSESGTTESKGCINCFINGDCNGVSVK